MNCSDAEQFGPLYWSSELDARRVAELEAHLEVCATCARQWQLQNHLDETLRDTFADEDLDTRELHARGRREIRASSGLWRRVVANSRVRWMACAALFVIVAGSGFLYVLREQAQQRTMYADAAEDHAEEVLKNYAQYEWKTSLPEIQSMLQEAVGDPSLATKLAADGYRIDRARICELVSLLYVHLVYTDGKHQVSVFVRRAVPRKLAGSALATVNGNELHAAERSGLQVAGFQSQKFTVLIVTDQSRSQALAFATEAAEKV